MPVTVFAVVPVVTLGFHVLVGILLCVELLGACVTLNSRLPVTSAAHMLVGGVLRQEAFVTSLTFESRGPMLGAVHVLVASTPAPKDTGTGLALRPVTILIHVVITIFLVPKGVVTGETLVVTHCVRRRM